MLALSMLAFASTTSAGVDRDIEINAGGGEKNLEAYYVKKGLKRFIIQGKEVWALNKKNAERKAKKS